MNSKKNYFIMGYPEAGKTTYLAALWYSLLNANASDDISYEVSNIGDSTYLSSLSQTWVNAEALPRTVSGNEQRDIVINIKEKKNDSICELRFADLSGETFTEVYAYRKIEKDIFERIKKADGFLLFVNVGRIKKPVLISNLEVSFVDEEQTEESFRRNPAKDDSDCIKIIDLIQNVQKINENEIIKLSVVLSAWDLAMRKDITPEEYIRQEMNILWQFLRSNHSSINTKIWGVSAQGGDLATEADKLRGFESPLDRIKVVNECGELSKDIILPIKELSGE